MIVTLALTSLLAREKTPLSRPPDQAPALDVVALPNSMSTEKQGCKLRILRAGRDDAYF
jgi:hypothetical protein